MRLFHLVLVFFGGGLGLGLGCGGPDGAGGGDGCQAGTIGCACAVGTCELGLACTNGICLGPMGDGDGDGDCPDEGLAEGESDIGSTSVSPHFFGVVLGLQAAVDDAAQKTQTSLDALATGVGLEAGSASADIVAATQAKLAANTVGSTRLNLGPGRCDAGLEPTASIATGCDPQASAIEFECSVPCAIDPADEAQCQQLTCEGTQLACEGGCRGDCQLDVAASCAGRCIGICSGDCTVTDAQGDCEGQCDGMCQGSCELVDGACSGQCQGTCSWTPPGPGCSGADTSLCQGDAICAVGCGGIPSPDTIAAECEAIVEAAGPMALVCDPTDAQLLWQYSAPVEGDAAAKAEFEAWAADTEPALGALAAQIERLNAILTVVDALAVASDGPVKAAMEDGNDTCALEALPGALAILGTIGADGQDTLGAAEQIFAAFD